MENSTTEPFNTANSNAMLSTVIFSKAMAKNSLKNCIKTLKI